MEETVYGFNIVVHKPTNTTELERRVAQAHADAIIAKVKKLNCSAEQKKALIDAICTSRAREDLKQLGRLVQRVVVLCT